MGNKKRNKRAKASKRAWIKRRFKLQNRPSFPKTVNKNKFCASEEWEVQLDILGVQLATKEDPHGQMEKFEAKDCVLKTNSEDCHEKVELQSANIDPHIQREKYFLTNQLDNSDLHIPVATSETCIYETDEKKTNEAREDFWEKIKAEPIFLKDQWDEGTQTQEMDDYEVKKTADGSHDEVQHNGTSYADRHRCKSCESRVLKNKDPFCEKVYKCNFCNFETRFEPLLTAHWKIHWVPVLVYKCQLCKFITRNLRSLQRHQQQFDHGFDVSMYRCHFFGFQTKDYSIWQQHVTTHNDSQNSKILSCRICRYVTTLKSNLNVHMATHKAVVGMYRCTSCKFITKYFTYLQQHERLHDEILEPCSCKTINRTDDKEQDLEQNNLSQQKINNDLSKKPSLKCELCNYETRFIQYLLAHKLEHEDRSGVKTYKCDSCSYETKYRLPFAKHLLTHRSVKTLRSNTSLNDQTSENEKECEIDLSPNFATVELETKDPLEIGTNECDPYEIKQECLDNAVLPCEEIKTEIDLDQKIDIKAEDNLSTENWNNGNTVVGVDLVESEPNFQGVDCTSNVPVELFTVQEIQHSKMEKNLATKGASRKQNTKNYKEVSKVNIYKSNLCYYRTKCCRQLSTHKLQHTHNTRMNPFENTSLDYETSYKWHLIK